MTCVHCLEHIQGFTTAAFPNDDPFRTHTKGVYHQVTNGDFTTTFNVGWPRLQRHHMFLPQLQFCSIFNGDNSLIVQE